MSLSVEKLYHSGVAKKSILIHASNETSWDKISNIIGLSWVLDVSKAIFLSKTKRGIGAMRRISFNNGNNVEEIIVGWKENCYLSYIAIRGLPLRAYHATISIKPIEKNLIKITWQSFFNSEKMSKKEFVEFQNFMNLFYKNSLANLKVELEK